jgi:NAD(P)-dependent dehydrogenase (short-subunit alcohol dehydrogenase family)
MTLNGKTAWVTGGGSGIGLACAKRLAQLGARVIVSGRDETSLKATGFTPVVMDVTDEASVNAAFAAHGPVDILVNNAGAAASAPTLKTSLEVWQGMLAVNLTGAFLCAKAALPAMVERGWGRYIVIASTASLKGYAYTAAYCAAKHGVLGLTKSLAIELAKSGVTANAVCPGFTQTALVNNAVQTIMRKTGMTEEAAVNSLTKRNPMGRLVLPDEVAEAVAYLASPLAAATNGEALVVDGGEGVA